MIPHNRPTLGSEEEAAALRVIRSGWLAQGREVEAFETQFCRFIGLPAGYAVAVSSGTAALFLALEALQAKGKRVAIPVYACTSLRHAVAMANAEEILVDSSIEMPGIDLQSSGKWGADVAIVPHLFGLPIDISKLRGMTVIEDCAQCLGASVDGRSVGLQGDVGVYSFSATKLITSGGQGGMVVSRDKALVDAVRDYREFDGRRDRKRRFNFQMTDMQAAIGREQLRKLPAFLARRAEIYRAYESGGVNLLGGESGNAKDILPIRYRAVVQCDDPGQMIGRLSSLAVKVIVPVEDWELLGDPSSFPNAQRWTGSTLSLPLYPSLSDKEIQVVLSGVNPL